MAGTQQNNTMAEFCNKMMKVIADAKQMPDADMEFLGAVEGDILAYLKPPVPADMQPQAQSPGMGPVGDAMGAVMGGGGGGGGAPMVGAGAPNPDEFRRMLQR